MVILPPKTVRSGASPAVRIELQHVVARRLLRLRGAVVVERADAGIGPADPVAARPGGEILADRGEQVVGLAVGDGDRGGIAVESPRRWCRSA